MDYEVDLLAVGEESKGGDAIALRYGNLDGSRAEQTVIVIDGGYMTTGHNIVDHVNTRYSTNRVDIVVSTHPDGDHVTGLEVVLEKMEVGQLLMHQPWRHSSRLTEARAKGFRTLTASQRLQESLREASVLEAIANRRDVPILEPFAGVETPGGIFRILGPTEQYYEELLAEIQGADGLREAARELMAAVVEKARSALVKETLEHETLRDGGVTSPQNNTSVISSLTVGGTKFLFTADAGIPALEQALDRLEADGFAPDDFDFVQVHHHGSRRNVGPTVLDRLLGPAGQTETHALGVVSAPKKNPENKHPAKKTENAFIRRGYDVHRTQGVAKCKSSPGAPSRPDYSPSTPVSFHDYVEEDSDA
jgi:beta-lactamase superfamily II metal-dependent hydrolase